MGCILLVEDETSISDPLAFLLGRAGYEVVVVSNGRDAVTVFERAGADLVLLDLQLPGVPGMHLCRQLRQRSDVPIIMLTARDTEMDTVAGLDAGADDYVTKPFSSGELLARMRALLRRRYPPEPAPPAVLGAGRIRMDVHQHRVTVEGTPVTLSVTGFRLLEVFLSHPAQLLTRGQLIDQVWGPDSGVETKALDAQIARVRRRIEPDPAHPRHLTTVRGVGYVYEP